MAIIQGGIIGDIRGKLGGNVFSRVRGRNTVRVYTVPVQPRTIAQLAARARFGGASQSYHAMSDLQKAAWGAYATTTFNAKNSYNQGQYSGSNAFMSLRNGVANSLANEIAANWEDESSGVLDGTKVPFEYVAVPPISQLAANAKTGVPGVPASLDLGDCTIDEDGLWTADITFGGITTGGLGQADLTDAGDNPIALVAYISEIINQSHNFVQNPEMICVGAIPALTGNTTGSLTTATGIKVQRTANMDVGHYKAFPAAGDIVQIKIYATTPDGMYACIGEKRIDVDPR